MRKNIGFMTLLAVGGYFVWRNRFEIRRFLEAQGFKLPIDMSDAKETIGSVGAKVLGKVDHTINSTLNQSETRKAI